MKKLLLFIVISSLQILNILAQNNVGVGTVSPSIDAVLDISASDKGLLIPRLNTQQMNNIFTDWSQCQPGLMIFNIDDNLFYYNAAATLTSTPIWVSFPIKKCPTNFIAVGNEFCIQANPQSGQQLTDAATTCQNVVGNSHLCSWSEWFSACNLNSPSIFNMTTGGGEWVDDITGFTTTNLPKALLAGDGACSAKKEDLTTAPNAYRCCFRR